ncbi:MAG: hypothetical protein ACI3T9_04330 [Romboutsia timonensis]
MKLYIKVISPVERVEIRYNGNQDWQVVRVRNNKELYKYLCSSEEEAISYYNKMN